MKEREECLEKEVLRLKSENKLLSSMIIKYKKEDDFTLCFKPIIKAIDCNDDNYDSEDTNEC